MKKTTRLFIAALLTIAGPFVNAQKIDIKIDSLSELAVPPGFEKIDQEIVISTMEAQMKYDVRSFSVKPNAKVKLVFKNPDTLPHNLIICTPGKKKGGDRDAQLLEELMICALIEARSCERFRILSENLEDKDMANFYRSFMISEAGHYRLFMDLAKLYFEDVNFDESF